MRKKEINMQNNELRASSYDIINNATLAIPLIIFGCCFWLKRHLTRIYYVDIPPPRLDTTNLEAVPLTWGYNSRTTNQLDSDVKIDIQKANRLEGNL